MHAPARPSTFAGVWSRVRGGPESTVRDVSTAVTEEALAAVGRALSHRARPASPPHPKLVRLLKDRAAMAAGDKPIDWGMGEALAFGTLLGEGVRVRMSGQDVRRGTFSHRHAVLVDYPTGRGIHPAGAHHRRARAPFEIRDSPLSEAGVLGFEYGYSLDMPEGLVVWEAQFGDFVNGAQVIIDQFLVSSEAKWNRVSGLVMLLPHGMEGQGPEHSSARLERFLNMCVNDNIQVCNVTTPGADLPPAAPAGDAPLPQAADRDEPQEPAAPPGGGLAACEEFTRGPLHARHPGHHRSTPRRSTGSCCAAARSITTWPPPARRTGLQERRHHPGRTAVPAAPRGDPGGAGGVPRGHPGLWVQEEARNMGAWHYISRVLPVAAAVSSFKWSGVSRPLSASPATGSLSRHNLEHAKLHRRSAGPALGSIVVDKGKVKKGTAS